MSFTSLFWGYFVLSLRWILSELKVAFQSIAFCLAGILTFSPRFLLRLAIFAHTDNSSFLGKPSCCQLLMKIPHFAFPCLRVTGRQELEVECFNISNGRSLETVAFAADGLQSVCGAGYGDRSKSKQKQTNKGTASYKDLLLACHTHLPTVGKDKQKEGLL